MSGSRLAALVLGCALLCSCSVTDARVPELLDAQDSQAAETVKTVEVVYGSVNMQTMVAGQQIATDVVTVMLDQIGTTVIKVNVKIGDIVNVGDVLCELAYDGAVVRRAVTALEERLAALETYREIERRAAEKNIGALELKAVDELGRLKLQRAEYAAMMSEKSYERQIAALLEQLAEEREKLEPVKITSEVYGVVYDLNVMGGTSYGSMVGLVITEPVKLVRTYNPDTRDLKDNCRRADFVPLQKVTLYLAKSNETIEASYADNPFLLSPSLEYALISINVSEADKVRLLAEGFFVIRHGLNAAEGLIIPKDAVYQEKSRSYVYIYEGGMKRKRYVEVSASDEKNVMIREGLAEGQIVALY